MPVFPNSTGQYGQPTGTNWLINNSLKYFNVF